MQITSVNNIQFSKLFGRKTKITPEEVAQNHIMQEKKDELKSNNTKTHFIYPQGPDIAKRINKIYYCSQPEILVSQIRNLEKQSCENEAVMLPYKAREYYNQLEGVISVWKKNHIKTISQNGKMFDCMGMYYDVDNHRSTPFRIYAYKKNNALDYVANFRGNDMTIDFQEAALKEKYQTAQMKFFGNELKEFVLVEKVNDKKIKTTYEYSDLRLKSITQGVLDMPCADKKIIYKNGKADRAYLGNVKTLQNGLIIADNVINC